MNQLERATRDGLRVSLMRRGTEYVVVARRLVTTAGKEGFIGLLTMTGEELRFDLDEVDAFQVIG